MALVELARSSTVDLRDDVETDEKNDDFDAIISLPSKTPKSARLRSPSFEGYFASRSGAFALQCGNTTVTSTDKKIGEIQMHLEYMISLLREIDVLRMAVRVESKVPKRKRYLTVVSSEVDHSAIIGIDWNNEDGPTIGLVLPLWSSTVVKLDGDGGFNVSRTLTRSHIFKPVSVQTLWSARQVIDKAIDYACRHKYFEGISTNGFLEFYEGIISSDPGSIGEWNEMDDLTSHVVGMIQKETCMNENTESIKQVIKCKLREIMRRVDLDSITCKAIRLLCENDLGIDLKNYKKYIDEEMLVVMGQMDSATKIFDYLYLGSEWNASNLVELKEMGIGYILNITREVDNFFPQSFVYYNIRVFDVEETELLKHWDHTYRFIEKAREFGSKVLVHCRHGISRSASTVIAYAMKQMGWGVTETLEFVKEKRNIVEPNPGFLKQLIVYGGILNSSRNRYSSLFHQRTLKQTEVQKPKTLSEKRKLFMKTLPDKVNSIDEMDGIQKECANSVTPDLEEHEVCTTKTEALPTSSIAEVSLIEEVEVEQTRQCWNSSTPHKGRLQRAMTMVSGAVFIDQDEISEIDNVSVASSENLTDPDEDAIMEQVVMATQRKNELMRSVLKLQDETNDVRGDHFSLESNIKPSVLRRLSHGSATLHFENIANIKKRRSLIGSDLKEAIVEEKCVIKENTVATLSGIFLARSKKHVRDYRRRRTLDDEQLKEQFNKTKPAKMKTVSGNSQRITEIPDFGLKLELASKSEKILPEVKTQFPRYRRYGTFGRSSSLSTRHSFDHEKCDNNKMSNKSFEALNLETSEHLKKLGVSQLTHDAEFCVADLVHFHDKIIRGKVRKRSTSSTPLSPNQTESDESISDSFEKLYHVLVRGTLKGIRNSKRLRLKRVQSFPGMKRCNSKTLEDGRKSCAAKTSPRDAESCQSLPSSPNLN